VERLMRRRIIDIAFWTGLGVLALVVVYGWVGARLNLPLTSQVNRWWWPLVIAGLVLVVPYFLPRRDPRAALGVRSVRYGLNTAMVVVLLLGVITVVEALSFRHNARLDLTENRRQSLSSQTVQVLKGLKTKVKATAFYRSEQPGKRLAEERFKDYARVAGDNFSWRIVDLDQEPILAKGLGADNYGVTVLEAKGRTEKIQDADQEDKLTNGLVKVLREGKLVLYVVQGHGEADLASTERRGFAEAKNALEKANYEAKPLALARQGKVPDDATVLIIPGPRSDFFPPEIDAVDAYLNRGGKVLAMIAPTFPERSQAESVRKLLGRWGLTLDEDLVIELSPIGQLFGFGPHLPLVQQYEPHPITRDMTGFTTVFPLARSLSLAKTPPQGIALQPLARTTADSWGETDRASLEQGQVKPDPQDPKGPLTLAAVATKDKARLVVYGTANLAINEFLNVQNNRDFFLNTISWLAEQEDQISIRPKETKSTPVFLTSQQAQAAFWLPVVILPGVAMVGGIVAVARRRAAK
jgi:ABC-type uncharacterized transport system involved in gliding motility auxiliary subunit